MNEYKLRMIIAHLRSHPVSGATHEEQLSCHSLDELLPLDEQQAVIRELAAIHEAERFMERWQITAARWG
ncbi:MAG: hypothetical protein AAGH88_09010 [Planctomycetota bacterium]